MIHHPFSFRFTSASVPRMSGWLYLERTTSRKEGGTRARKPRIVVEKDPNSIMAKKAAVCSYTVEGRALIHTNLSMNSSVLSGLRNQPSMGRSTELTDSRISLFSAQRGKCALSGELFENAADIVCWLKTPAELGGKERYRNMILFHNRFLPLLQECPKNELKEIADTLKATKELMLKVNSLRQQAGLSAIEN